MIRAKYTVALHTLMTDPTMKEQLDKALSTYPLYQAGKAYDLIPSREELNTRLLNHYKYREIGFETIGRFLDELKNTMGEIMPKYNELFKTIVTMAEIPNPFDNVDVVETFEEEKTNTSTTDSSSGTETTSTAVDTTTTTGTASSHNKHIGSKTPQDKLSVPAEGIDSVDYADEAQWNKDSSETTGTSSSDGSTTASSDSMSNTTNEGSEKTKHTYTKKGNQGVNTYAHDMNEFRTSIIDVVDQIVNDSRIRELFMLIY
jgi:cytoskeletal protein RodZ